jgi:hypothetical protein
MVMRALRSLTAGSLALAFAAATLIASGADAAAAGTSSAARTAAAQRPQVFGTPPPQRPHPKRKAWPVTLTIRTLPATPGVRLRFDSQLLSTDRQGVARVTVEHDFLPHTVTLSDVMIERPEVRMHFTRWTGQRDPNQAYSRTVTGLPMRADYTMTAAFTVQYPVTVRLVEQNGKPLDTSQVSSISVKSDTGKVFTFPISTAMWLDGVRPLLRQSSLTATRVSYSMQSVIVRSSNVIDSGRQVFQPAAGRTATVTTQFFDLTVKAHDALFGSVHSKGAIVIFPDGSQHPVDLGPRSSVTLRGLPRGHYRVVLDAGSGIASTADFVLSRDKTTDVAVISVRDLLLLGGVIAMIAVVLLVIGRASWLWRLRRRKSHWTRAEQADDPAARAEEVLV